MKNARPGPGAKSLVLQGRNAFVIRSVGLGGQCFDWPAIERREKEPQPVIPAWLGYQVNARSLGYNVGSVGLVSLRRSELINPAGWLAAEHRGLVTDL
jgi:hypothetical protein